MLQVLHPQAYFQVSNHSCLDNRRYICASFWSSDVFRGWTDGNMSRVRVSVYFSYKTALQDSTMVQHYDRYVYNPGWNSWVCLWSGVLCYTNRQRI